MVYLGKYNDRQEAVVKKVKDSSYEAKARCSKEAALLNSTKGNPNIVEFLGMCDEPKSIMTEYVSFNFSAIWH